MYDFFKIEPIDNLETDKFVSPLKNQVFVPKNTSGLFQITEEMVDESEIIDSFCKLELAGPKEELAFEPTKMRCALVTCGGLCPGLNDVIRSIVMTLYYEYGVREIFGVQYGLEGLIDDYNHGLINLTPDFVTHIHQFGGTVLGSSRGKQDISKIVDFLLKNKIDVLFILGGDGSMKAALGITREIMRRGEKISVIGVPKTIDNDIYFIPKSFGFDTAVEEATKIIQCAHTEAIGAYNGIGLVKLMGRESGFIAAQAVLGLREANFILIPEMQFEFDGENGFLQQVKKRLEERHHAVIVVAEGAGQDLCNSEKQFDASGNPILEDICDLIQKRLKLFFKIENFGFAMKYLDPSYSIRSVPANINDKVYCSFLGQNAVHAGLAGKTGMVVAKVHGRYVNLPISIVAKKRRKLNTSSAYWRSVISTTGQSLKMMEL